MINPDLEPKLLRLTAAFEGGGVVGNFDGAVLSWGLLQWNLAQNTLPGVLLDILRLDGAGFRAAMGEPFTQALTQGRLTDFVRASVLDAADNRRVRPDYRARFAALERLEATAQAFALHSRPYLARAERDALKLGFETERGLALCFDIAVQNGGVRPRSERSGRVLASHLDAYWEQLPNGALEEWQRLKALAHAVANCAKSEWRNDVLSRKLTIAVGRGRVHGKEYVLTDYGVRYYDTGKTLARWAV